MRYLTRLAVSVSFAFLLGSVSAAAQVPIQPQYQGAGTACMEQLPDPSQPANSTAASPKFCFPSLPAVASCPVSLRAQHGADGTLLRVDKARPEGLAQLLHIILTSKNSRQIVEAHLRVRGASGKGQVSPMNLGQNSMDATRNVTVKLRPTAENEVTGDTWVRGMSAVLQVELSWVTFDDGSIQRFGAAQGCRFTPEHLMLIADR